MSPTKRLTRSAPDTVKAQEFASRQRQSQAAARVRKSGVGRELASLEIDVVVGQTAASSGGTDRRYDLRGGSKDVLLAPKAARVTKSKGNGRKKKVEKVYLGPGYQQEGVSEGAVEEGERECLICAETLSGYVLFISGFDFLGVGGELLM